MRFVNCSRCEDEQNLVAHQFRGEICYRTYKYVNPGEELLVWYGESYAKDLGISVCEDQVNRKKGNGYTCHGCERMYTSMNFLQRHKNHYCSPRTLNWECRKCKKQFTSVSSLNMHIRQAHADEKRTQSTQCDKAFIRCNALTTHLRTHTGEKSYQCTQCNKAFNDSSHLTMHLRTHTGEKPYQCTQYNKAFNDSSHLTMHLRTHTGEKPYHFTQCNKGFNSSSHLATHLRTYTGEKPYQCFRKVRKQI
ncbi:zinc finger protein 184-like [Orbicella faveolata]|uniref:zinc finger protein 184-like n=1 Tax=Orbicella faveolata TaxID=48498 RepID=UPI0009E3077A|nr:zinc finger protein 184-like [Orbicella faveolata]